MKYANSIEIALPRERVAQLLADPAHLPKWLRGLVLHEPVNGIHGQLGTKSRVVLQSGKRKIECTETITRREPADLHEIPKGTVVRFDREIVGAGMWSVVRDRLTEAGPETTLWESESSATRISDGDGPLLGSARSRDLGTPTAWYRLVGHQPLLGG